MKNIEKWKPSKFIWDNGKLVGNKKYGGIGSRLITDIVANYYCEYLPKHAHGKLLDLGCGLVPLFDLYKKYVSHIVCADWENSFVEIEFLDVSCDLNKELPFANNEFDTVILSDVLEHIQKPQLLLKEISRILNRGGILIANVPFFYWLHATPYDYYRYTEYALKSFIEEEKLEMIFLESMGGALEVLGDICSKILVSKKKSITKNMAIALQEGIKQIRRSNFGEKLYVNTRNVFPYAYFMVAKKVL